MNTFDVNKANVLQFMRYGVIGVLNNLWGYGLYLLVTYFWLEPMAALSLLYPVCVMTAFWGHSKYSFKNKMRFDALLRFVFVYFIGYIINLCILSVFVDWLHVPHQLVQGITVFVVATIIFVLCKHFVYVDKPCQN